MANARTVTASDFIAEVQVELRDSAGTNYGTTELLAYLNRCSEEIYEELVDLRSELVRTGTGTVTTVDGTQSYDLSANSMGDFWVPHRVWITNYEPMDMCEEEDLYDAINQEEMGDTSRSRPEKYCIVGDYIWFEDVPDDAYTVNFRYFPNFVPIASTESLPYKNLFNNEIKEGMKILAKNRNSKGANIDAILKDIFRSRALNVLRRRTYKPVSIVPRMR